VLAKTFSYLRSDATRRTPNLIGSVKGAPQVLKGVPGDSGDEGRCFGYADDIPVGLKELSIRLYSDHIRVGVLEGDHLGFEITDVLFGPFNFYADKIESVIGCHE
jgi:hypothetical protein